MVLNPLIMGKLRQGVMAVAAGLALAGCSEANAEGNDSSTKAEIQQVAAVIETTKVTRDQCMTLATKAEKIACMKTLKAQRVAEITAKKGILETEQSTGKELNTSIDVLSKEIDAVYVEAAKTGGTQ